MTEHLPECEPCYLDVVWICICNQLRACEQRVLKDTVPGEWHEKRMAWVRKDALDAAREAVVAVPYDEPEEDPQSREHEVEVRQRYLAAIDALREEQ